MKEIQTGAITPISRGRRCLFRGVAAILLPVSLILVLEVGLRLAGYGHPTSFFLSKQIKGRDVFVENGAFGFQFFPVGMARSPAPIVMPKQKGTNTYRIFVFGESAALGDPKPAYGFGRYLQTLLNERYPAMHFEVICAAMTAINSHAILPIARECARHQGDLWLIYAGNNEMIGPFGASGLVGERTPGTGFVRATLSLKRTRVGQLLDSTAEWINRKRMGKEWLGLKMFVGHQIAPDDPARERVAVNFRENIQDILETGQRVGVKIIMSSVAGNLKDCAPHASMHSTKVGESAKLEWEKQYTDAIQLGVTNCAGAIEPFKTLASIDPEYAELHFRAARCYAERNAVGEARHSYELARDYDALPFRTTSPLNEIIRGSAAGTRNVVFTDLEKALAGRNEIAGNELFFDHVHFNFDGNYKVARLFADEISKLLPVNTTITGPNDWLTREQCELRLGLTDWNRYLAAEMMLTRLSDAPYTNQLSNPETRKQLLAKMAEFRKNTRETDRSVYRDIYEQALSKNPNDYFIRQNYAEFLELSGKIAEAENQWTAIQELIPQHPVAFFQAGRLLLKQEKFPAAEGELQKALAIRNDFPDALIELGRSLAGQEKHQEAIAAFSKALSYTAENAPAHFYMANSLIALHKKKSASEHLREAIGIRPGYWEAHYLLGVQLAEREQFAEAAQEFSEVARIQPDFAGGHFNLGVALAKLNRIQEAALEFQKTLRLDPRHKAARDYLMKLQALQEIQNQVQRK